MNIFVKSENIKSKKILATLLCLSMVTGQAQAMNLGKTTSSVKIPTVPVKIPTIKASGLQTKVKEFFLKNEKIIAASIAASIAIGSLLLICTVLYYLPSFATNKKPLDTQEIEKLKQHNLDERFEKIERQWSWTNRKAFLFSSARGFLDECKNEEMEKIEIRLFFANAINLNIYDAETHETPLEIVCTKGNFDAIKLLVKRGAIIRQKDINATTDETIKKYLKEKISL